jgi:SAM-dependent methyltransferase
MARYNTLYSLAHYYDIAFRRDISGEVAFLDALFRRETGRAPVSVADLACGPGYHARDFARRGLRAVGLDLRPEMVEFARAEAAAEGCPPVEWVVGDIRDFTLTAPVDLILTSYDSIDCLADGAEIVEHFAAVARNLTPQGLYVFELTHPRDCRPYDYQDFSYHGARDGVRVDISWAVNKPVADPLTQLIACDILIEVDDNGTRHVFHDHARERFTGPGEFMALAKLSGALTLVEWFGDFRLDQAFDNSPGARRMIGVLRRSA